MTAGLLDGVSDADDQEIGLVLLLSPKEAKTHFMNKEFESPSAPILA